MGERKGRYTLAVEMGETRTRMSYTPMAEERDLLETSFGMLVRVVIEHGGIVEVSR